MISDEGLFRQWQQGYPEALESLVARYHRLLLAYLYRLVGEAQTWLIWRSAPDSAIQLYQQILTTEPYYEHAHRGPMRCFVARGEPSRAIAQFRAHAAHLREDLRTIPARETCALCQSILEEMETARPRSPRWCPEPEAIPRVDGA